MQMYRLGRDEHVT